MDFRKKPSKGLGRRKKSDRSDEQQWLFTYTASSGKRGESGDHHNLVIGLNYRGIGDIRHVY